MNRERIEAKVNDREALVAALKLIGGVSHQQALFLQPIIAAARERLSQLPEKCPGDGMSARETLAAALDPAVRDYGWLTVLEDAARERLAQLPEKCEICDGTGWIPVESDDPLDDPCPPCHGSGKVYPAELVERIADAIAHAMSTGVGRLVTVPVAVAVLDALNGETE